MSNLKAENQKGDQLRKHFYHSLYLLSNQKKAKKQAQNVSINIKVSKAVSYCLTFQFSDHSMHSILSFFFAQASEWEREEKFTQL